MYDADPSLPELDADQLYLERRLTGIEPVRQRRAGGDSFESPLLGRLQFAQMPSGRPSYWHGEIRMPDSRFGLRIVCEVESDRAPGADHIACVVALRRLQLQDAILCAPMINKRLETTLPPRHISADELVLTSIHLPPRPLIDARFELGFRARSCPLLSLVVVFVRGVPRSVRVDSDG